MVIVKLIKNKIIETIELRPWQNGRFHLLSILNYGGGGGGGATKRKGEGSGCKSSFTPKKMGG